VRHEDDALLDRQRQSPTGTDHLEGVVACDVPGVATGVEGRSADKRVGGQVDPLDRPGAVEVVGLEE
jgi:hypothetical protein